ncbi:MAG: hypothetical protein KDD58_09270 [Bdellovibrionales bacterium]|nr:hypothetical protein [Bdellovibrionales bacterium]
MSWHRLMFNFSIFLIGFLHIINLEATCIDALEDFSTAPLMQDSQALISENLGFEGVGDLLLSASLPGDVLKYQEKRSIRLLSDKQLSKYNITGESLKTLYGSEDPKDYYIFANFTHGNVAEKISRFWIAIIPRDILVNNIYLHIEWFLEGAGAHFQYRMKLNKPITLVPQSEIPQKDWYKNIIRTENWKNEDILNINSPMQIAGDFVYTLLALRTENGPQNWGPIEGVTGAYANGYSFQSTIHTAEDQTNRNWVQQIELVHPGREAALAILDYSIKNSHNKKETNIYNTVYNSCVTAAMEALFANGQGYADLDINMFNPYRVTDHLKEFNLIKDEFTPSLNDEFNASIKENDINQKVKQKVDSFLPIIQTYGFDLVVRHVTSYIVIHRWSYQEILILFHAFQNIPAGSDFSQASYSLSQSLAQSDLSPARIEEIKDLGEQVFKFIISRLGSFDPELAQIILNLNQQD